MTGSSTALTGAEAKARVVASLPWSALAEDPLEDVANKNTIRRRQQNQANHSAVCNQQVSSSTFRQ
jgi:hypothetical protein